MNQQAQYTTEFGGISSFLIIVVVILFFFSNILEFFAKTTVTTSEEIIFSDDPSLLELNQENYMVAFSISQTNFSTQPFFNISVEQRTYNRDQDGKLQKTIEYIELQECKYQQFDRVFSRQGINFTDQFNALGLQYWLCPKDNFKLNLKGTYASGNFQFIKIVVRECQNSTNQTENSNVVCASEETKTQYLNKEGQFKLQIYQINTIINPNKAKDYFQYFLDSDMYFTFVPKKLSRQANIYFREAKINNDLSLLPYEDIEKTNVVVRKNEDFRDLTELGRDNDDQYAIVYLRKSPFTELISRQYQKLGELLSYLGGVVQIMKLAFGIIIIFINRQLMLIELCNKLYDFKENIPKSQRANSQQNFNSPSMPQETNRSRCFDDNLRSPDPDPILDGKNDLQTSTTSSNLKNAIDNILSDSQPIKVSFKLILHTLTFGLLFRDNNAIFLEKAIERMNQDLNLHNILYRLQEVSKIKRILFNQDQLILFNFTPKPQISLHENNRVPSRLLIQESRSSAKPKLIRQNNVDFDAKNDITNMLIKSYLKVKEDLYLEDQNNCLMKLNYKLIELLLKETNNLDITSYKYLTQTPKRTYLQQYQGEPQIELNNEQIGIEIQKKQDDELQENDQ